MQVAIVNRSTTFKDDDLPALVYVLATQARVHFAPIWGNYPNIVDFPTTVPDDKIDPIYAQIVLLDTSDQAGALGYHNVTPSGKPLGRAFVGDDLKYNVYPTQTISHELLEMLADPSINAVYMYKTHLLACEVCDPVEDAAFAYQINGLWVSDFIYPSWFGNDPSNTRYDYTGAITKPLQIAKNGYIGRYDLAGKRWRQVLSSDTVDEIAAQKADKMLIGSRRFIRRLNSIKES